MDAIDSLVLTLRFAILSVVSLVSIFVPSYKYLIENQVKRVNCVLDNNNGYPLGEEIQFSMSETCGLVEGDVSDDGSDAGSSEGSDSIGESDDEDGSSDYSGEEPNETQSNPE